MGNSNSFACVTRDGNVATTASACLIPPAAMRFAARLPGVHPADCGEMPIPVACCRRDIQEVDMAVRSSDVIALHVAPATEVQTLMAFACWTVPLLLAEPLLQLRKISRR